MPSSFVPFASTVFDSVLFRDALAGESVALTVRSGGSETVQLKLVSSEGMRAARGILP